MAVVAGRSTRSLDGMQNRLAKFFKDAPSFWHRAARANGALGIFAAVIWVIDWSPVNFAFWTIWAIAFLTIGTVLSTRGVTIVFFAIFAAGFVAALWHLALRHAV